MADKDHSESAFLEFLRQSAVSGIVKPATGRARKLAAEQLLVQLKSHERLDLRLVDIDELCSRFHKLQGSTIRPENLDVYNQRLGSALKDFIRWCDNPAQFVSNEGELPESKMVARRDNAGQAVAREELTLIPVAAQLSADHMRWWLALVDSVRHLSEAKDKSSVTFSAHRFLANLAEFDGLHL